jgi:hypothetical protein
MCVHSGPDPSLPAAAAALLFTLAQQRARCAQMAMYFAADVVVALVSGGKNNSCILNNAIITGQTAVPT